jgi:hypothetical protein
LESGEIGKWGDGAAGECDETVLGFLLGVLVDETTGVDRGHIGAVERLDLLPFTGVGVATILGKA